MFVGLGFHGFGCPRLLAPSAAARPPRRPSHQSGCSPRSLARSSRPCDSCAAKQSTNVHVASCQLLMTDAEVSLRLNRAVVDYLTKAAAAPGAEEGLEVAVQCLGELDSFAPPPGAETPPTVDLLKVFQAGITALTAQQAAAAPPPSAAPPPEFDRFLESLERRGYFTGAAKGTAAYEKRFAEARAKFVAKFGCQTASEQEDAASIVLSARRGLHCGDHEGAIRDASRLIDAGDAEPGGDDSGFRHLCEALGTRSLALLHQGKLDGALADAETAAALAAEAPASARAHTLARLGLACEATGNAARACESYVQALEAHEMAEAASAGLPVLCDARAAAAAAVAAAAAAAAPAAQSAAAQSAAPFANDDGGGTSVVGFGSDSNGTAPTHLALAPRDGSASQGALLAGTGAPPVDFAQLSAFLADPAVLATAERVADNFLSGDAASLDDVRTSLASLFGGDAQRPRHPALCQSSSGASGSSDAVGSSGAEVSSGVPHSANRGGASAVEVSTEASPSSSSSSSISRGKQRALD